MKELHFVGFAFRNPAFLCSLQKTQFGLLPESACLLLFVTVWTFYLVNAFKQLIYKQLLRNKWCHVQWSLCINIIIKINQMVAQYLRIRNNYITQLQVCVFLTQFFKILIEPLDSQEYINKPLVDVQVLLWETLDQFSIYYYSSTWTTSEHENKLSCKEYEQMENFVHNVLISYLFASDIFKQEFF